MHPRCCLAASADNPAGDAHYLRKQILHNLPQKGQAATALDRMHFATEPVPNGWLSELLEAWTSPRKVVRTAGEKRGHAAVPTVLRGVGMNPRTKQPCCAG